MERVLRRGPCRRSERSFRWPVGSAGGTWVPTVVVLRDDVGSPDALYALPVSGTARWRPVPFDVLLAALLLTLGQWQIHAPDPHRVIAHPVLSAVVWAVTASALAWRSRFPWQTFTIVVVGVTVEALPAPDSGTLAGFVALCVVLYTVARVEVRVEKTVAATAIAVLALLLHYARDPQASNAVESIQATYVVLLACPVVARLVAGRATRSAVLESELAVQEQRHLEAARLAVAAERARIARELHDVIAHSVSVTIVQSMAAQAAITDRQPADAQRRLTSIEQAARNALADMRRLVAIDDADGPAGGEAQPRMATLPTLVQQLRDSGAHVHLDQQGPWTDVPLGADLALFRITQEALTNAVTHAPGAAIEIRVSDQEGFVAADVINGVPTAPDIGPGGGRGLVGMRERVQLYGGTLQAGRRPDGGYRVYATLPTGQATG